MKIHLLAIIILLISFNSYSQDTINLMNGKQIVAKSLFDEPSSTLLKFDIVKKNRVIQKAVDRIDIFSINYSDKTQNIFYHQDTAIGFRLSTSEMNNYILGEREALKSYKAPLVGICGFVIGAALVNFKGFWGLLSPAIYGTMMGVITPKVKASVNISSALKSNKNFVDGYKFTATRKKVRKAILGTIIGIVAEVIVSEIINAH